MPNNIIQLPYTAQEVQALLAKAGLTPDFSHYVQLKSTSGYNSFTISKNETKTYAVSLPNDEKDYMCQFSVYGRTQKAEDFRYLSLFAMPGTYLEFQENANLVTEGIRILRVHKPASEADTDAVAQGSFWTLIKASDRNISVYCGNDCSDISGNCGIGLVAYYPVN